jgi:hypothetical protein
MARTVLALMALASAVGLGASAAEGRGRISPPLDTVDTVAGGWKADVRAAKRYARGRTGSVWFAFIDPYGRSHGLHAGRTAPMASLFKPLVMATYLSRPSVKDRSLHGWERDLLGPMIRRSANEPATRLRDMLGAGPIKATARKAGMRDFSYSSVWGLSRTSARDQARFFLHLDRWIPKRHEDYARYLLKNIVSSQRWGVADARPKGWDLFFKGGWGVGTGRVNHQAALYEQGGCSSALSVMTEFSPGHDYGTETIEGVAERLLQGIRKVHCGKRIEHGTAHPANDGPEAGR